MKRLIMMFLCVFLLAGSAQAVTITGMTLYGGAGQVWNTVFNDFTWELGVSSAAEGPLLNTDETTISVPFGNYYLYAEPTNLGSNPKLEVNLSDGTTIAATFQLVGESGSGEAWNLTAGDSAITLGWASGTANLVGGGENMSTLGNPDFYLQAGIHANPVPIPGAVWLLGSGLVGLAGLRRRFGR
jgi:hypothetical protein